MESGFDPETRRALAYEVWQEFGIFVFHIAKVDTEKSTLPSVDTEETPLQK